MTNKGWRETETVEWSGYTFPSITGKVLTYTATLSKKRFEKIWKEFKEWNGSQEEFYFWKVNPLGMKKLIRGGKKDE